MRNFLATLAIKLGGCTVPNAELWALLPRVDLTRRRGFKNIILESDSSTAVSLITN